MSEEILPSEPRRLRRKGPENPYPGLRAFEDHEARIFFGRDRHINEILERLATSHFVPVLGPSGCGKSSLIKAGVIPALRAGRFYNAGTRWRIAKMQPGTSPIWNLAEALYKSTLQDDEDEYDPSIIQKISSLLIADPDGLEEFQKQYDFAEDENILLLVDQFEEVFSIENESQMDVARTFIEIILSIYQSKFTRVHCIMTMRTDHLGDCTRFIGFAEAINETIYITPKLTEQELHEVIELPAIRFQSSLEDNLLNRILTEMKDEIDQLPLMQHIMRRIWDSISANDPEDRKFTHQKYEELGGVENTINNHAAQLMSELSTSQKRLVPFIFRQLTDRREGATYQDVRRPTLFKDMISVTGIKSEKNIANVIAIIERFRQQDALFLRPLTLDSPTIEGDTRIDIVHECLIRKWDDLKQWVEEEWKSANTLRELVKKIPDGFSSENKNFGFKHFQDVFRVSNRSMDKQEIIYFKKWYQDERPTSSWANRYQIDEADFDNAEQFLKHSAAYQSRSKQRIWTYSVLLAAAAVFWGGSYLNELEEDKNKKRNEIERIAFDLNRGASTIAMVTENNIARSYDLWQRFTTNAVVAPNVFDQSVQSSIGTWIDNQKWLQQKIVDLDLITIKPSKFPLDEVSADIIREKPAALLSSTLSPKWGTFASLWTDKIVVYSSEQSTSKSLPFPPELKANPFHESAVDSKEKSKISYLSDDKSIFAVIDNKEIWQVRPETGEYKLVRRLEKEASQIDFSRDGTQIAIASEIENSAETGTWQFEIMDLESGEVITSFEGNLPSQNITAISFEAARQNVLAVLFDKNHVTLWNTAPNYPEIRQPKLSFISITELKEIEISEDAQWIAGREAFAGHVWSIKNKNALQLEKSNNSVVPDRSRYGRQPIKQFRFLDNNELLFVRGDGETVLWNYQNGNDSLRRLVNSASQPLSIAINTSGLLSVIDSPSEVLQWDLKKNKSGLKHVHSFQSSPSVDVTNKEITSATIAKNGGVIAVGSNSGTIELYKPTIETGSEIVLSKFSIENAKDTNSPENKSAIVSVSISDDGTNIIASHANGMLTAIKRSSKNEIYLEQTGLEHFSGIEAISISPDGKNLVVTADKELHFYEQKYEINDQQWAKLGVSKLGETTCSVSYSDDSKQLVIGTLEGNIYKGLRSSFGSQFSAQLVQSFEGKSAKSVHFVNRYSGILSILSNQKSKDKCPKLDQGKVSSLELTRLNAQDKKKHSRIQQFEADNLGFREVSFLPHLNSFILTEADSDRESHASFQFVDLEASLRIGSSLKEGILGDKVPTTRYFDDPGPKKFDDTRRSKLKNLFATQIGCEVDNCWMIAPTYSNQHFMVFVLGKPLEL